MNEPSTNKLTELVDHHRQMLKDAESGNWEKVTENEVTRQILIKDCYSGASEEYEVTALVSATQELLKVNEELKQYAEKARDTLKKDLAALGKGKAAISAYAKHMS